MEWNDPILFDIVKNESIFYNKSYTINQISQIHETYVVKVFTSRHQENLFKLLTDLENDLGLYDKITNFDIFILGDDFGTEKYERFHNK